MLDAVEETAGARLKRQVTVCNTCSAPEVVWMDKRFHSAMRKLNSWRSSTFPDDASLLYGECLHLICAPSRLQDASLLELGHDLIDRLDLSEK